MDRLTRERPHSRDEEALQYLLSLGAAYRPAREAPAELVHAALGSPEYSRRMALRVRRPALVVGMALPVVVCLAIAGPVVWRSYGNTQVQSGPRAASTEATTRLPAPTVLARGSYLQRSASARVRGKPQQSRGQRSSPRRLERPTTKKGRSSDAVPRVKMRYETVKRYYAGLLAPALLQETDSATGRETTTPVIVDLPVEIAGTQEMPLPTLRVQPAAYQP